MALPDEDGLLVRFWMPALASFLVFKTTGDSGVLGARTIGFLFFFGFGVSGEDGAADALLVVDVLRDALLEFGVSLSFCFLVNLALGSGLVAFGLMIGVCLALEDFCDVTGKASSFLRFFSCLMGTSGSTVSSSSSSSSLWSSEDSFSSDESTGAKDSSSDASSSFSEIVSLMSRSRVVSFPRAFLAANAALAASFFAAVATFCCFLLSGLDPTEDSSLWF